MIINGLFFNTPLYRLNSSYIYIIIIIAHPNIGQSNIKT